ncbi:hypothetical protein HK096_010904 [Nowakowskiella sp. JEL0078]|nr:hypothetical protein HK096_010904 [Nowakowskiella sp. JEL0078]
MAANLLIRGAFRKLGIRSNIARTYSTPAFPTYEETMLPNNFHAKQHAKDATAWWVKFNIFFTFPVLAVIAGFVLPEELKHLKHLEEHPIHLLPYHYIRKRKNEFPWGDNSLFHNSVVNTVAEE